MGLTAEEFQRTHNKNWGRILDVVGDRSVPPATIRSWENTGIDYVRSTFDNAPWVFRDPEVQSLQHEIEIYFAGTNALRVLRLAGLGDAAVTRAELSARLANLKENYLLIQERARRVMASSDVEYFYNFREELASIEREQRNLRAGCYIATAVYGSYDAPAVLTLRRYRDERLNRSARGRQFVRFYYAVSPALATHFGPHALLGRFGRVALDVFVCRLNALGYAPDSSGGANSSAAPARWAPSSSRSDTAFRSSSKRSE